MKTYMPQIRKLLRGTDGMAAHEAAKALNLLEDSTRKALRTMPDAYIDRWVLMKRPGSPRTSWYAVWCVAEVPDDCPHPEATRDRTPRGVRQGNMYAQ